MHLHLQEQIRGLWVEQLLVPVWEETPKVASPWKTTPILSYSTQMASLMWGRAPVRLALTRDSWSWTAWMKTQWMPTWGSWWGCVRAFSGQRRAARVRPKVFGLQRRMSCSGCAREPFHQHRLERNRWKWRRVRREERMKNLIIPWISCSACAQGNFQVRVKKICYLPYFLCRPATGNYLHDQSIKRLVYKMSKLWEMPITISQSPCISFRWLVLSNQQSKT